MAEGGDAEDEIQFLRTVRLCFSVRMCVCETIIREDLGKTRHVVCRAPRRAASRCSRASFIIMRWRSETRRTITHIIGIQCLLSNTCEKNMIDVN